VQHLKNRGSSDDYYLFINRTKLQSEHM